MKIIAMATKPIRRVFVSRNGFPGSVNIFLKICITSPRLLIRKNIQAKLTIINVIIILLAHDNF